MQPQDTTSLRSSTIPAKPTRKRDDPEYRRAYRKAYYAAHRQELLAKVSTYYQEHREEKLAYARNYVAEHYQALQSQAHDYYEAHREEKKRQAREWQQAHPQQAKAKVTAWCKAHPDRHKALAYNSKQRRRVRLRGAPSEAINREVIIARDRSTCGICGKKVPPKQIVLDHILPVAHGGAHLASNLQVAHRLCNLRKATGAIPSQLRLPL